MSVHCSSEQLPIVRNAARYCAERTPAESRPLFPLRNRTSVTQDRRYHGSRARSLRDAAVIVREFPTESALHQTTCERVLNTTAGSSLLIRDIEELRSAIQDALREGLEEIEAESVHYAAVRLISGTTVSLLNRLIAP